MASTDRKVIPFSREFSSRSTVKTLPRTRGEVMSLKRSLPLLELCEGPTRSQVLHRAIETLQRLDSEQIQIVQMLMATIARGAR
jgi:hypothetical protein